MARRQAGTAGDPAKIVNAKTLTGGEASSIQTERGIALSVLLTQRGDMDTIIALELDTPADRIKPVQFSSMQNN